MGNGVSLLTPSCLVSTGCCIMITKFSGIGFLLPLACEVAHRLTGQALYAEGKHKVEGELYTAENWQILEFGIRSFSLNFCGRLNHVFDTIRRCLAPVSAGRSGRMIHDIVVARIQDNQTGSCAFAFFGKEHNGDLIMKFCKDLEEVDEKGKPVVFGSPQNGWWKRKVPSHSLILKDLLEECWAIPAQYQPVTNNCHHLSKDLWNWHANKIKEAASVSSEDSLKRSTVRCFRKRSLKLCGVKERVPLLYWPKGKCRSNRSPRLFTHARLVATC